jgi:hypothetical protein
MVVGMHYEFHPWPVFQTRQAPKQVSECGERTFTKEG